LCTSWRRDGYTFDGCIAWLTGSSPAHAFYQYLRQVGAPPGPEIVDHDEFERIKGTGGKALMLNADVGGTVGRSW
jgi:hypothetical protein